MISSNMRAGALCAAASTLALSAAAFSLPVAAHAAADNKNNNASVLGEVVVTAQKRSENLQSIPVAVTAFTAQARDKSGIVSAQQQMNFTPGVTYDPSTDHLDIRGVGKVTTYIGTDPGVAVYQDGYYVGSANALNQTTLEEERVEVLRGPQGTLYGRNSIGGAVNAISRRPDSEFTGDIRATWNDYVGQSLEARASGPVTDWLKLSAYVQEVNQAHDYFTNVPPHTAAAAPATPATAFFPALPAYPAATCDNLNFASVMPITCQSFKGGTKGYGGRQNGWVTDLQASWDAGPNFDGWVRAYFSRNENALGNEDGVTTKWDPIPLTVPSVFYGYQGIQQPGLYRARDMTGNRPFTQTYAQTMYITQDTWHGPGFDVKFIGGYWHTNTNYIEDGDAVPDPTSGIYVPTYTGLNMPGPLFDPANPGVTLSNNPPDPFHPKDNTVIDANQLTYGDIRGFQNWSTELNVTSTDKGPLQWLFGLYYYSEIYNQIGTYQTIDTPQYDHVTDYLFQHTCLPFSIVPGGLGLGPNVGGTQTVDDNLPTGGGPGVPGGNCATAAVFGGAPTTIASAFGYNAALNHGGPSTLNNGLGLVDKVFGIHNSGPGSDMLYGEQAKLHTQSEAIFAQLDWHPNDQWHFTLGARYSGDQKQGFERELDIFWIPMVSSQAQAAALGFPIDPATGLYATDYVGTSCSAPGTNGIQPYSSTMACPAFRHQKASWSAPTGTAGVEWTPSPATNVYVRYNRGYKSGGFNLGPLAATTGGVEPEFIDDFEGGWKQQFGRTFQFDIAAFYYLYHGLQALNETTQNSSPPIQINELINIAQAKAYGVEFEARWNPFENLNLALNYSYLGTSNDTTCTVSGTPPAAGSGLDPNNAANWTGLSEKNCFVDSANPGAAPVVNGQALTGVNPVGPFFITSGLKTQPQSLKGNGLPYSPTHKVSFNASYTFKFEPGDLTLATVFNWHSQFFDNLFATQEWLVPAGDTTDFRVSWTATSKRYEVIGTVSNAFNNTVLTAYSTLPPGNAYYAYNALQPPRVFTLELRYHF